VLSIIGLSFYILNIILSYFVIMDKNLGINTYSSFILSILFMITKVKEVYDIGNNRILISSYKTIKYEFNCKLEKND
jgi:hypothetical protein